MIRDIPNCQTPHPKDQFGFGCQTPHPNEDPKDQFGSKSPPKAQSSFASLMMKLFYFSDIGFILHRR